MRPDAAASSRSRVGTGAGGVTTFTRRAYPALAFGLADTFFRSLPERLQTTPGCLRCLPPRQELLDRGDRSMPVVDTPPRGSGTSGPSPAPATGVPASPAVPSPRIPLPRVSVPTLLLFAGGVALWVTATWLLLAGVAPPVFTVPLHAIVTFTMFTVVHESAHHAAGKLTWVNETLGRLAMPFVAVYASFPLLRFIHSEHHRNTNADSHTDPDAWTSQGSWWQLPFRWLTIDFWYARFYAARARPRPPQERAETIVVLSLAFAAAAALVACGHGRELLFGYVLPQRLGLAVLAWWFDWL